MIVPEMLVKWLQGNEEPVPFFGFCWHHDTKKKVDHSFLYGKIADIYLSCLSPPARPSFEIAFHKYSVPLGMYNKILPSCLTLLLLLSSLPSCKVLHTWAQCWNNKIQWQTALLIIPSSIPYKALLMWQCWKTWSLLLGREGWAPGLLCTSGLGWIHHCHPPRSGCSAAQ